MSRKNLGRTLLALLIVGVIGVGIVALQEEPAGALVHEIECPALPICASTDYLKIYGWCDEPNGCTMYRYQGSSSPHCLVCN